MCSQECLAGLEQKKKQMKEKGCHETIWTQPTLTWSSPTQNKET
jgi:hypothetical protein